MDDKEARQEANHLVKKYIGASAENQINLPAKLIQSIVAQSENPTKTIFDGALLEVSRMLEDSFRRFCRTPHFINFIEANGLAKKATTNKTMLSQYIAEL